MPLSASISTIRSLLADVKTAPSVSLHHTPGIEEPRRLPTTPAVVGLIDLAGEFVPAQAAAQALGLYYGPMALNEPGKQVSISHLIGDQSRFCQAGGQLVLANGAPASATDGTLYTRPDDFRVIEPAAFGFLADGADAPAGGLPTASAKAVMATAPNYTARFTITRKAMKELPADLLHYEIAASLARGLANLVDRVALGAIAAETGPFSFSAITAKDVRADELRAIAGKNATGFAFNATGQPTVAGMPADLSPAISDTIAGVFSKAAVFISDDTRIVLRRQDVTGSLDVLCHVNMVPALPDAGYFGKVAA